MKYSCPKCGSNEVYAGVEVVDSHFNILRAFAGCNDCGFQRSGMVKLQ